MLAYKFRHLAVEFNALLDSGKHNSISVDDVKRHAEAGTISAFLIDRFGKEADFSLMEPKDWSDLNEEWRDPQLY